MSRFAATPSRPSAQSSSQESGMKNIVAIGATGVGKSSLLNHILGLVDPNTNLPYDENKYFPDRATMNKAGTSKTQSFVGVANNFGTARDIPPTIRLVDCPGLGDPAGDAQDRLNISNMVSFIKPLQEVHQFVLVMNSESPRLSSHDEQMILIFLKMFKGVSSGDFFRNMVVAFTHWGMDKKSIKNRKKQKVDRAFIESEIATAFTDRFNYEGLINCVFVDNLYDPEDEAQKNAMAVEISKIWMFAQTNLHPFKTDNVKKTATVLEGLDKELKKIQDENKKLQGQQKKEREDHKKNMDRIQKLMADQTKDHEAKMKQMEKEIDELKSSSRGGGLDIGSLVALLQGMNMGGGGMMQPMMMGGGFPGAGMGGGFPGAGMGGGLPPGATHYQGRGRPRATDARAADGSWL